MGRGSDPIAILASLAPGTVWESACQLSGESYLQMCSSLLELTAGTPNTPVRLECGR